MPTTRSSRLRRPVVVVLAMLLSLLGLLAGSAMPASALPLDSSLLDGSPVAALPDDASPATGTSDAALPGDGNTAPELTLPIDVTFVVGQPGDSYAIEANGDPVPTVSVDGLPPGLQLTTYEDGSAILHGTPTGPAGVTAVEVRAANTNAISYGSLTVVVQQQPAFVDRGPLVFTAGVFTTATIRTTGFPAPGIGLDGDLPVGLTFVDHGDGTGTIFGTPLGGPESAPITLTAVNEVADVSLTTAVEVLASSDHSAHSPDGSTR